MKTKLMVLLGVAVLVLAGSLAPNAQAAAANYFCTVYMAGPTSGGIVYAVVTDTAAAPAFTKKWIKVPATSPEENQFLATALTAMASGKRVQIYIDPAVAYPTTTYMYLTE